LLFEQVLALRKEVLGEKHPLYALSLYNLAWLLAAGKDPERGEKLSAQALAILQRNTHDTFSALSERQRLDRLSQQRFILDGYLSMAPAAKTSAERLYAQVLAWKGIAAARAAEERLALDRPELTDLMRDLRLARAGLARLAAQPPNPTGQKQWRQSFDRLE